MRVEALETLTHLQVLAEALPHEQSEDPEQGMVPNESCAHCWIILSAVPQLRAALAAHPEAPERYIKCKCAEKKHHCHICESETDMACSDCRINFGESIYVCAKPFCRNEHEHGYCCGPSRRTPAQRTREQVIEECAKECDSYAKAHPNAHGVVAMHLAARLRALSAEGKR